MTPIVSPIPTECWVDRLRKDSLVWLVKEQEYASVALEWEPPEPGHRAGRICIDRYHVHNSVLHYTGQQQTWFVGGVGEGLDGKQLLAPCEGHLPERRADIPEPVVRKILRTLDNLRMRIERIEISADIAKWWSDI